MNKKRRKKEIDGNARAHQFFLLFSIVADVLNWPADYQVCVQEAKEWWKSVCG